MNKKYDLKYKINYKIININSTTFHFFLILLIV